MKVKVVFIFLLFFNHHVPKNMAKKVDKAIKKTFISESYQLESIQLADEILTLLEADFSEDRFFKVLIQNEHKGYAYLGNAPSKTDRFDYLLLFDKQFSLLSSKVLIYREDYGGEIGSKRWLKQFIGASPSSNFRPNENIMAISGATISVNSMTADINKVLASLRTLIKTGSLE